MSYINQYVEILDNLELNHSDVQERENGSETVHFGYSTDLMGKPVTVIVTFDEQSVEQTIFGVAKVPEDKITNAILLCNDMNSEYRFLKFYIDSENNFVIENDAFLDENSAGDEVFAITKMVLTKIDDIYKRVMKAVWA